MLHLPSQNLDVAHILVCLLQKEKRKQHSHSSNTASKVQRKGIAILTQNATEGRAQHRGGGNHSLQDGEILVTVFSRAAVSNQPGYVNGAQ